MRTYNFWKPGPAVARAFALAAVVLAPLCATAQDMPYNLLAGKPYQGTKLNILSVVTPQFDGLMLRADEFTDLTGIEADRERCKELLELNPSIATALNAAVGYDKAATVAKKAAAERKSVRQVVKELGLLTDDELDRYLDVREMTEPGIPGS